MPAITKVLRDGRVAHIKEDGSVTFINQDGSIQGSETQTKSFPAIKSAAEGFGQGAALGFADEGAGAIASVGKNLMEGKLPTIESYRRSRDSFRDEFSKAKEANPKSYATGEFSGAAVNSLIPGFGATTIPKMAFMGGIQALGNSEADLTKGEVLPAVVDTGTGALTGGITGFAVPKIGKLMRAVTPDALENFANKKAAKALGFTKRFLNTPNKKAAAIDTGKTMLEEGVVTPFASAQTMADRVNVLKERAGSDIGSFLKQQGNGFETKSAINAINSLRSFDSKGKLLKGGEYDKLNGILDKAIETVKAHGDVIPFEEANNLKGFLQNLVNYNSDKAEGLLRKSVAGKFRETVDTALENNAFSDLNGLPEATKRLASEVGLKPDGFKSFLRNKKVYGAANRAEDALTNRLSSEDGNNLIGLTEIIAAAPQLATGNPVGAGVTMGMLRAGKRYGNQILATGANRASKASRFVADKIPAILKASPEVLGKYGPILQQAAARGASQVALTHGLLMKSDPKYRTLIEDLEGN